jgi:ATP-binding cassette subfamily B (MDR/TAP) protein 1
MMSVVPCLALTAIIMFRKIASLTSMSQKKSAEAGGVAEESLSSIRTVVSCQMERREIQRYVHGLEKAMECSIASGYRLAGAFSTFLFLIFGTYGLGLWFGSRLIIKDLRDGCVEDCHTGGDVLVVFWSILNGAMGLSQCSPNLQALTEARGAAAWILSICRRTSAIDPCSAHGLRPADVEGRISFDSVKFRYASRPETVVLDRLQLSISPGQTVALVGRSGCGKSTLISLLERFYDPEAGTVLLDGVDIRELNIGWLRSQIGLVSQEPTLFSASVAENIAFGVDGATQTDIEQAAKMANAHDFILSFPEGYSTHCGGQSGAQLSGGQKQRIAIARAIIKDPPILLLDEATSALDNESERVVQEALDNLLKMKRRTTIVIAHRLSTVRNADCIAFVHEGRVVERGTHNELMQQAPDGKYRALVLLQQGSNGAGEQAAEGASSPVSSHPTLQERSFRGPSSDMLRSYRRSSNGSSELTDEGVVLLKESMASDGDIPPKVSRWRLWRLSLPESRYFASAMLAATFSGAIFPAFSLIFSRIITYMYVDDPDELERKGNFWSSMFLVLATVVGTATFVQVTSFTIMGERLTTRLRKITFEAMMRQDLSFYDDKKNSTGALCTRLATEATLVKSLTGQNLGRMYQNVVNIGVAFAVAFIAGDPGLTLILAGIMPFLIIGIVLQFRAVRQSSTISQEAVAEAGMIASQSIDAIRTVTSLGMIDRVMMLYTSALKDPLRQGIRQGLINGFMLGFTQLISLSTYAFVFWYGGNKVIDGSIPFGRMLQSLLAITMAAQGIGQTSSFLGDGAAAQAAAARIFAIVDRKPLVPAMDSPQGECLPHLEGRITFDDVRFRYPAREEALVLDHFSLSVQPGQTAALVGQSGCGKSTLISLLERFYDPEVGTVLLDGVDIRELNIGWLRSQIGLVSQEPTLFSASVSENIAFGMEGATAAQIEQAAKLANAHDFIMDFDDGYDTMLGPRGVLISGGQKQRIAIARAIIKDPPILLLDEATSALDSESEKVVQEALDRLLQMRQRTTIVIAHRLSTVRNADCIAVVHKGRCIEKGTHEELMRSASKYRMLVQRGGDVVDDFVDDAI